MSRPATTALKVVALADGTLTTRQIAERLGVSRPYVTATLHRRDIAHMVKRRPTHQSVKVYARRLEQLLRRAHDAMSRTAEDAMWDTDWDQIVADIATELGEPT